MPFFDTLCGYTAVASDEEIWMIGSGLAAGTTYYLYTATINPLVDASTGNSRTTDAYGNLVIPNSQGGTTSITYWLHSVNLAPVANRVANALPLGWSPGGTVPVYGTPPILTNVIPGDGIASLKWDSPTWCDSRISSISYSIRRSASAPPPNPVVQVGTSNVNEWLDPSVPNNAPRWWMIRGTIRYVADLIALSPFDSNVLSTVPREQRTYLGTLAKA